MNRFFLSWFRSASLAAVFGLVVGCGDDDTINPANGGVTHDSTYTANHLSADDYDLIPDSAIVLAQSHFDIYYGHTSHGNQIMTGLILLANEDALAQLPTVSEI